MINPRKTSNIQGIAGVFGSRSVRVSECPGQDLNLSSEFAQPAVIPATYIGNRKSSKAHRAALLAAMVLRAVV
jgi:hypothetical protein